MPSAWKQQRDSQKVTSIIRVPFVYIKKHDTGFTLLFTLASEKYKRMGSTMLVLIALSPQKWWQKAIIMFLSDAGSTPLFVLLLSLSKKSQRTAHGIFSFVCPSGFFVSRHFYFYIYSHRFILLCTHPCPYSFSFFAVEKRPAHPVCLLFVLADTINTVTKTEN